MDLADSLNDDWVMVDEQQLIDNAISVCEFIEEEGTQRANDLVLHDLKEVTDALSRSSRTGLPPIPTYDEISVYVGDEQLAICDKETRSDVDNDSRDLVLWEIAMRRKTRTTSTTGMKQLCLPK